ncbi:polysaccharide deacetylase family protein [Horticoccus sp. 23ND18S-11]|uniref:polysaccharide deacetylase family protein n=1 Tax=Horticoccus sp. 23ND18S-11 TaxID=3391832 RepID=UPI0039C995F3
MRIKSIIKASVGTVAGSRLVAPAVRWSTKDTVNILYYHFVGPAAPHYRVFDQGCTPAIFERDLLQLRELFTFCSLDDVVLGRAIAQNTRPPAALMFDDGLNLFKFGATDILHKLGIPANTAVITSCVGNERLMWRHALSVIYSSSSPNLIVESYNRLASDFALDPISSSAQLLRASLRWRHGDKDTLTARLWSACEMPAMAQYLAQHEPYFSWEQIQSWCSRGHSLGFHTHTHPLCGTLNKEELAGELLLPARELKSKFGLSHLHFSFPFGSRLQPELEEVVVEAGVFTSLLGTGGFRRRQPHSPVLERACAEVSPLGWAISRRALCNRILPSFREARPHAAIGA